jgi:hypothetical protein
MGRLTHSDEAPLYVGDLIATVVICILVFNFILCSILLFCTNLFRTQSSEDEEEDLVFPEEATLPSPPSQYSLSPLPPPYVQPVDLSDVEDEFQIVLQTLDEVYWTVLRRVEVVEEEEEPPAYLRELPRRQQIERQITEPPSIYALDM